MSDGWFDPQVNNCYIKCSQAVFFLSINSSPCEVAFFHVNGHTSPEIPLPSL